jgi:hypothetical protein
MPSQTGRSGCGGSWIGKPHGIPGTYLNSFYELRPLPYPGVGYSFPGWAQTIVK